MQFFNFTPQETKALLFLLAALLVGSGITLYKRSHPQFAPELIIEEKQTGPEPQGQSLPEESVKTKININQATAGQLQLLPHIGPSLSRRIVEYRESNGRFERIEDLMQVHGVGPKTLQKIKDYIAVE